MCGLGGVGTRYPRSFHNRRNRQLCWNCGLWEGPIRTLAGARAPPHGLRPSWDEPELVMDPEFLESERLERRLERQADAGCELQLILDPDFLKPVPQALFSPSLPPVR